MNRIIGFSAVLPLLFALACTEIQVEDVFHTPSSAVAKAVLSASEVHRMYTDTTFVVAPGVEETDVHFQVMSGYIVRAYIIEADLNTPGLQLRVCTPNNANTFYQARQTLTDMANIYDQSGSRVAAMINGDYWDTGVLIPRGPIHRDGLIINEVFNYSSRVPQQALSYIAVDNMGRMEIDVKENYSASQSRLKECTGAGVVLLKDGMVPKIPDSWKARDPRTAIGYTQEGKVYLLVADGRQEFLSYGLTYAEMSSIFAGLGCTAAATLDGGGSTQMLIKHPIARTWQIRNSPSDGAERAVFNGWMITVDEH